jgi:hypothetical protein
MKIRLRMNVFVGTSHSEGSATESADGCPPPALNKPEGSCMIAEEVEEEPNRHYYNVTNLTTARQRFGNTRSRGKEQVQC